MSAKGTHKITTYEYEQQNVRRSEGMDYIRPLNWIKQKKAQNKKKTSAGYHEKISESLIIFAFITAADL